jgi:putative toxin-antitoxin system antitoxin component (TIGR02293 family)
MITVQRIVKTLGGTRVLKRRTRSLEDLLAQLRMGLPYASVEALAAGFGIGKDELVAVLHLPPRTLARRKREQRLRADESDRLFRLGRIAALAEEVFGRRDKASRWLHRPNPALGDVIPLRHLDTDLGVRQVEDLLLRIAHGVYS